MKKKTFVLATVSILLIILTAWWCIHITILQLKFSNDCDKFGSENNYEECDVSFLSYPISNVNGECSCYLISKRVTYRDSITKIDAQQKDGE